MSSLFVPALEDEPSSPASTEEETVLRRSTRRLRRTETIARRSRERSLTTRSRRPRERSSTTASIQTEEETAIKRLKQIAEPPSLPPTDQFKLIVTPPLTPSDVSSVKCRENGMSSSEEETVACRVKRAREDSASSVSTSTDSDESVRHWKRARKNSPRTATRVAKTKVHLAEASVDIWAARVFTKAQSNAPGFARIVPYFAQLKAIHACNKQSKSFVYATAVLGTMRFDSRQFNT